MKATYNEVIEMSRYGRAGHGWTTYPIQLCARRLLEGGIAGRLEIYPNDNEDGDGLPDVIYQSIANAATTGNSRYLQKGHHYAGWYPIAEKNRTWSKVN
jgi:hypothetical protein